MKNIKLYQEYEGLQDIKIYHIQPEKFNLVDSDYLKSERWSSIIVEKGGFEAEAQYMAFDIDGMQVDIYFSLYIEGRVDHDPGNYWTPSYTDVEITKVDIDISEVLIDCEYPVVLNPELNKIFTEIVERNL